MNILFKKSIESFISFQKASEMNYNINILQI